ncbi:MAG: apolipoprotein N-acyltransferase [Myxococcales bacterium]|nr:apolipoprotein N-acyltransferase [Myxococcales bacterium]
MTKTMTNKDWRSRLPAGLTAHWPGALAILFYLVGFAFFPFLNWLLISPLLLGVYRWVKAEDWPALLTGLLYVLCFPHARLGFLGFVCLAPVLYAALRDSGRRALWLGFLAGTVGNLGKLYWLVYTISYFSPIPFPVAVLILLLLCSTLGLFWGLQFRLLHWAVRERRLPLWLVFPAGWVCWDFFLIWFLGGFPWEVLGDAAFHIPVYNQTLDLVGSFGLGWVFAFGNVVAVELWRFVRKERPFPTAFAAALAALVVAGFLYGAVRTPQIERAMRAGRTVKVGMLQGNVDQSIKWKAGFREEIMENYARLAEETKNDGAELIIMPETAIPRRQDRMMSLHPEISRYATDTERYVLTGVPSKAIRTNVDDPRGPDIRYNSAVLISPQGDDLQWYDKNRLVPFGEYIPKKHWLERIAGRNITGTLNFEPSGRYALMPFPGAPFAVFICYEAVYPSTVRRLNRLGARFLVTITNDAWFGNTSAPYQHWAQVAIRAIENRRYVARAANTGISGIIDPLGRTLMATDLYREAELVGSVGVMELHSLYERIGDVAAYAAHAVYLIALAVGLALSRRRGKE